MGGGFISRKIFEMLFLFSIFEVSMIFLMKGMK